MQLKAIFILPKNVLIVIITDNPFELLKSSFPVHTPIDLGDKVGFEGLFVRTFLKAQY